MTNILELLKNEKVEWKKLGEVCEFNRGKTITKKNAIEGDIPVIGGGQKPAYYHNESNREGITITVAGSGAYAGFVSYWEQPIFLSDAFSIEPNQKLNKRYLFHWLLQNQSRIYELKQGSGVPHVYGSDLAKFEIPIPSLEIQEKIVEILDKFTSYAMELQSELQSRTKQYTYYRDKLLSEEYLTKVTKEMEEDRRLNIFKLDEIFDFKNGLNKGKEYFGKGVPFISYVNVYKLDRLHEQDIIEKVELTQDEIARFSVAKGDVLFTRTSEVKEEVGYSSVVIEDLNNTVFNGFTIRARLKNSDLLLPEYSAHLFRCHEIRKEIIRRSSFTTRASLSGQELGKVKVVIPPLSLQNKIVKVLDKFQVLLADTKGLLPEEIEQRQKQYEYYREKLLTFDVECSSTHARTSIISNNYYNILQEAAIIVEVDIEDKIELEKLLNITKKVDSVNWKVMERELHYIDLSSVNIGNKRIEATELITKTNAPSRAKQIVKSKDIIFGTTRPMQERLALIPDYLDNQVCSTGYCVLRSDKENVKEKWIYYNLLKTDFYKYVELNQKGASYPAISDSEIKNYKIPIPPLHVQQHVVSILDKFDTLVNDIKEGLPKEIEQRQQQYEYWREHLLNFKD